MGGIRREWLQTCWSSRAAGGKSGRGVPCLCGCSGAAMDWRGLGVAFKLSSELRTAEGAESREKGLGIWEGQWQRTEAGGQGGSW